MHILSATTSVNRMSIPVIVTLCLLISSLIIAFVFFIVVVFNGNGNSSNEDITTIITLNPINGFSLSYINSLQVPDQGKLKSCGAVQISTLMSYYYYIQQNKTETFSALYLYYYGRTINGDSSYIDNGSTIDNYLTSINIFGLTTENDWPYIISNVYTKPKSNITIYNPELKWDTITRNITTIKTYITQYGPILLDINLYSSFSSINASGIISIPNIKEESYLARHTVSLWGWDDDYNMFIMLNTWGKSVGYNGWYFLPYDYLLTPNLSTQFVYNISFTKSF